MIRRTFEAIDGAHAAIVHLYNSTSTTQRRVVFNLDMDGVRKIATDGAELIKELVPTVPNTKIIHQYSPESYTQTELPYAMEVCEAVMDIWQPTPENKTIINLPATVEVATPNVYADGIEWMHRNFSKRENVILSLHPHNDRSDRRCRNRAGNSSGRRPGRGHALRQRRAHRQRRCYHARHEHGEPRPRLAAGYAQHAGAARRHRRVLQPVASPPAPSIRGRPRLHRLLRCSHQDAINKGLKAMETQNSEEWDVPYLPIDPADVGASYEAVIRINSQSGKGGIAYIMETEFGIQMPRALQVEFSGAVQKISDLSGEEQTPEDIWKAFDQEYLSAKTPYEFIEHQTRADTHASEKRLMTATLKKNGMRPQSRGLAMVLLIPCRRPKEGQRQRHQGVQLFRTLGRRRLRRHCDCLRRDRSRGQASLRDWPGPKHCLGLTDCRDMRSQSRHTKWQIAQFPSQSDIANGDVFRIHRQLSVPFPRALRWSCYLACSCVAARSPNARLRQQKETG